MASFPTSIASFLQVTNLARTTLAGSIGASDMTANVVNATSFDVFPMAIVIDSEIILISGKSGNLLTIAQRGYDGTVASPHSSTAKVRGTVISKHITQLNEEMIAVQDTLRVGFSPIARKITVDRTQLTASALTQTITTSVSIGAKQKVTGLCIRHYNVFASAGGSVLSVTMSVGTASNPTAFYDSYSLSNDPAYTDVALFTSTNMDTAQAVVLTFTSTGGNLSALTGSGSVDIWLRVSNLE